MSAIGECLDEHRVDESGQLELSDTLLVAGFAARPLPAFPMRDFRHVFSNTRELQLFSTGDTTTSQLSTHALSMRFLTRTREEVDQLRACLPEKGKPLEALVLAHVERVARKISASAHAFEFREIDAIAAAIELLAHDSSPRPRVEQLILVKRLDEQVSALEIYVEFALAEKSLPESADSLPMSAYVPRYATREK
jgi:hypothetical protein